MDAITRCRSCHSSKLVEVVDLGEQYISDFRDDGERPPKYPLTLLLCGHCKLVQLKHTTPSAEMYHERYGFKSGVNDTLRADLKDVVASALHYRGNPRRWLDIASNDGTLLSFVPAPTYAVGIDPIKKLCDEAVQHGDLIVNAFFSAPLVTEYGEESQAEKFDVVTSISMFYDIDDPNKFVKEVASVMESNGVWVIQQNYLLSTLELGAIDNICHEHLEYYSLIALENLLGRHGLEVFHLTTSGVNGGSLRTFVARKGDYEVDDTVRTQRIKEYNFGMSGVRVYKEFGRDAMSRIAGLRDLVNSLAKQEKTVFIYGASTRGATIWQAAGFGPEQIECAVERNPDKVGKRFSAINIPIISEEHARAYKPDYILIGPWFVAREILEREADLLAGGTKAIIPLPTLRII